MDEIFIILQTGGSIVSPLITIWLLWKVGLLGGKKDSNKNGSKISVQRNAEDIQLLFDHADVANKEMGDIKLTLVGIQRDIHYLVKNSNNK